VKKISEAWNRFFFEPTSGSTLGVFRFFYGLVVFIAILGVYPYRDIFYAADGLVLPEVMIKHYSTRWMILGFSFLPLTEPGLNLFFLALLVAAAMLSLGFFTRFASIIVFLGLYSLHNRNFYITNAGDLLMRINSLILLFADSGAAFSIDRWLRIRRGKESSDTPRLISPWPQRLIQLQVTYLYLTTAFLKLPGASWRDGTALYYALRYLELQRFSFKYLFYYLWQIKIATWGVIVAEAAMGSLVWVRKFRYPVLVTAFLLHMGINLTMQFPVFQYVMMVNLILFIYPEDLDRLLKRRSNPVE
jgi:hypothetical protein